MPVPAPFSIALDRAEPVVVLTAHGEVDASTVIQLGEVLDDAIRNHEHHVVVDATGVTFIDSTGVSALVAAMRRLNRARRRMALVSTTGSALDQALRMTGLHQTFDVHAIAEDAVAALAAAPLLGR